MRKKCLVFDVLVFLTALIASSPAVVHAAEKDDDCATTLKRKYGRPNLTLPKYDDDGSEDNINLYRNIKDMVALSAYIYQHAAMIEEACSKSSWWKKDTRNATLCEDLSAGKTVGQVLRTCRENLHVLEKKDRDVREATKVIKNDLADADATDATKDSVVLSINAYEEDVSNSCVYAITVNHKLKRLSVIFRGTSNMGDWGNNVLVFRKSKENPDKGQTNVPKIGIHAGFAAALFGDGRVDKILDEVKSHMQGLKGYRLFVTGHSLGGALATLFGFHAAANDDLMQQVYGPVSLFSVASPRVGDANFLEAHKNLEHKGRLRHARVHNEKDKVSRIPYLGGGYKHAGLEIRLRAMSRNLGPILDYPAYAQWVQAGASVTESVMSLFDALRLHGTDLTRNRLKFSKKCLEKTTLEREYRRLWGLDYAHP